MPPRQPDPLPVFLARHPLVLGVERRGFDVTVEVLDISSHRLARSWLGSEAARPTRADLIRRIT